MTTDYLTDANISTAYETWAHARRMKGKPPMIVNAFVAGAKWGVKQSVAEARADAVKATKKECEASTTSLLAEAVAQTKKEYESATTSRIAAAIQDARKDERRKCESGYIKCHNCDTEEKGITAQVKHLCPACIQEKTDNAEAKGKAEGREEVMETCSECQKAQRERGQADLLNELEQLNEKFYKEEMSKLHIPMKNRIPYQWTTYGGWISAKRAAIRKPGEKP